EHQHDPGDIASLGKELQRLSINRTGGLGVIGFQRDRGTHEERPPKTKSLVQAPEEVDGLFDRTDRSIVRLEVVVDLPQTPKTPGNSRLIAKPAIHTHRLD